MATRHKVKYVTDIQNITIHKGIKAFEVRICIYICVITKQNMCIAEGLLYRSTVAK